MLNVLITTPERVIYEGTAERIIVPGEAGTFEVLPLHRALASRLLAGTMTIDNKEYAIRRGVFCVADDSVTAVVELAAKKVQASRT